MKNTKNDRNGMTVIAKRKKTKLLLIDIFILTSMLVLFTISIYGLRLSYILLSTFLLGFSIWELINEAKTPRDLIFLDDNTGEFFLVKENIRINPNNIISVFGDSTKSLDYSGMLIINTVKSSYKYFNVCDVEQVEKDIITIAEAYREKQNT